MTISKPSHQSVPCTSTGASDTIYSPRPRGPWQALWAMQKPARGAAFHLSPPRSCMNKRRFQAQEQALWLKGNALGGKPGLGLFLLCFEGCIGNGGLPGISSRFLLQEPVRICERSSPKVTSRTQCNEFSMLQ